MRKRRLSKILDRLKDEKLGQETVKNIKNIISGIDSTTDPTIGIPDQLPNSITT